jgi:hypothetical protein
VGPRAHLDGVEPPLRQIIEVLQQVMCSHDAEKLAISSIEIYEDGHRGGGYNQTDEIRCS